MATSEHEPAIYAVLQIGGSTEEQYLHTFSEERTATSYMKQAKNASYRCMGPFEILMPAEVALARVAEKTVQWLKNQGYQNEIHTIALDLAILEVKKDLKLS